MCSHYLLVPKDLDVLNKLLLIRTEVCPVLVLELLILLCGGAELDTAEAPVGFTGRDYALELDKNVEELIKVHLMLISSLCTSFA